jgi:hypothetical protein
MSEPLEQPTLANGQETKPPSPQHSEPDPPCGSLKKWVIGGLLVVSACLMMFILVSCWPPPKPREGFTLGLLQRAVTVRPGEPATYTICGYARNGFAGPVLLETVVLPQSPPVEYAFAPYDREQKTGILVPSPAGSSALLTLRPPSGEEHSYTVMVAGTAGGQLQAVNGGQPLIMSGRQTRTITGRLTVTQHPPALQSAAASQQDGADGCTTHDGLAPLSVSGWTIAHISDETRLFLIVAIVGCLGGLLHAIRSWVHHAGHAQLKQNWMPFYFATPIVGMTMAILFYLLFRAGFIAPTTPAAETNTYGFAAIAGLVGLFSARASKMLENAADIIFSRADAETETASADAGAATVSRGEFSLIPSESAHTVAPGETAEYRITVTATQDLSASVRLTAAVDPVHDQGPTVRLNPDELTPTTIGTPVTLNAITTAETPPDAYTITLTATGGGKTTQRRVTLRVENGAGVGAQPAAAGVSQPPHPSPNDPARPASVHATSSLPQPPAASPSSSS